MSKRDENADRRDENANQRDEETTRRMYHSTGEKHLLSEVFDEYRKQTDRYIDTRLNAERDARVDADGKIWKELDNRRATYGAMWLAIAVALLTVVRELYMKGMHP